MDHLLSVCNYGMSVAVDGQRFFSDRFSGVDYVVAVDLGGTAAKIGPAYADGSIGPVRRIPTRFENGQVSVDWLAQEISAEAALGASNGSCRGYGAGVPGVIDVTTGTVRAAANLGWTDRAVRAELDRATGLTGALDHDVRSAGRAEWRRGAGVGTEQLIFVSLGTGIAAAMVVDNRLLIADGYAGELGHIATPSAATRLCACGRHGCLETVASASGVVREYTRLSGRSVTGADEIAERARTADPAAIEAIDLARRALGEGLAVAVTLLGPELVIIGGGLSGAFDLLGPALESDLGSRLSIQRHPQIVKAQLGPDAGLIGAGLLGWQHLTGQHLRGSIAGEN